MEIKFIKLSTDAVMPLFATEGSAGADMSSSEEVVIGPGETRLIPTGIAMEIPKGWVGLLFPRSGLSLRTPLRQPNSVGVIDSDYRGEVRGMFTNTGSTPFVLEKGTRMMQIVFVRHESARFVQCVSLEENVAAAASAPPARRR